MNKLEVSLKIKVNKEIGKTSHQISMKTGTEQ